ncbi:uncharacterized protein STEHIDRAFT_110785 [Stereum hirsutum FP-91666 SS1]|uniref:uncharacterized protein n=1 Tax=Stereum hirsutum (strain FP-91666) TaxID=721885 RepID=UPI000440FF0B|nr:uncharacterized protein STEHIDRAFT_110785 [Stereum hirsutum FP-91666 SS1]EIM87612.1 hypothetical protein STEHIDRAFT_110785 [Stereum hirsutum FP-91666 SS1]
MSQSTMVNNTHAQLLAKRIVDGRAASNIATSNDNLTSNLKHSFKLTDIASKGYLIPIVAAVCGFLILVVLSVYFFRSWSRVRRRRRMSVTVNESLSVPGKVNTLAGLRTEQKGRSCPELESGEESDTETAYTAYTDKTGTVDIERDRGSLISSLISPRSSTSISSSNSDNSQTQGGHYIPHHIWQASLQAQTRARSETQSSSSSKAPAWTHHARTNSHDGANTNSILNTQTTVGPAQKLNHQQQVAATRRPCHCKGCRDARKPSLSLGLGHVRSSLLPIEEADKEVTSPTTLSYDDPHAQTSQSGLQRKGSLLGRALSLNSRGQLSRSGAVRSHSQCRRLAPTAKDISRPARMTKEQEKQEDDWLAAFGDGIPISSRTKTEKENVGPPPLSTSPHARAAIPPAKGSATTATSFDNAIRLEKPAVDSIQPSCETQSPRTTSKKSVFVSHPTNAPRRPLSSTIEPILEPAHAPIASYIASSLVSQVSSISEYDYSNTTYTSSPTVSHSSRRLPSTSVTSSPSSVYSCNSSRHSSICSPGRNDARPLTRRKPSPRWEDILREEELKASGSIVPDAPKLAGLEDVQPFGRDIETGTEGVEMHKRKDWDCRDSAEPSTYAAMKWMAEEDWMENNRPVSYGYGVEKDADVRAGVGAQTGSPLAPFGLGKDSGQWPSYSRRGNVVSECT